MKSRLKNAKSKIENFAWEHPTLAIIYATLLDLFAVTVTLINLVVIILKIRGQI